jgi:chemotaxis protein histidine kinase CheA
MAQLAQPQPNFDHLTQLLTDVSVEVSRISNMPAVAGLQQIFAQLQQMNLQMTQRHNQTQQRLEAIQQAVTRLQEGLAGRL